MAPLSPACQTPFRATSGARYRVRPTRWTRLGKLTFLKIFFGFLSYNFSRGFPQAAWKGASLMKGAVSFSHITFPCRVCHFVFGKRRRMTVFSHITWFFRRLAAVAVIEEASAEVRGTTLRGQMPQGHGAGANPWVSSLSGKSCAFSCDAARAWCLWWRHAPAFWVEVRQQPASAPP
jgi:hypothetical protein